MRKKEETLSSIPLFDEDSPKKIVEKKPKKKLKSKICLYIEGWTRDQKIVALHEVTDATLVEFDNLIKAIKNYKDKDSNWNPDVSKVYDMYPKIKEKVIDKFEAYVPTGFDVSYTDENSRYIVKPGGVESIEKINVIRGTIEEMC